MILVPLAALVGLVWALYSGADWGVSLHAALVFAAAVFGCWALARELLPDDQVSAFISMLLGFLTAFSFPSPGLLTLFCTLVLVRIINRSSGLLPRLGDSIAVTVLVIITIYATDSAWFGLVGAAAFLLDGLLKRPAKRQWAFALICFLATVVYAVDHDVVLLQVKVPQSLLLWLCIIALLFFLLQVLMLKKIHSRGDADNKRLELERVKGGMVIGILATVQGLDQLSQVAFIAATIGGLSLGIAFRRAFRSPVKGLRSG